MNMKVDKLDYFMKNKLNAKDKLAIIFFYSIFSLNMQLIYML